MNRLRRGDKIPVKVAFAGYAGFSSLPHIAGRSTANGVRGVRQKQAHFQAFSRDALGLSPCRTPSGERLGEISICVGYAHPPSRPTFTRTAAIGITTANDLDY